MRSTQAGHSLVETTIATALLSVVFLGAASSVASATRMNDEGRELAVAREAARGEMERVLAWTDFPTLAETFHETAFDASAGFVTLAAQPGDDDGRPGEVLVEPLGLTSARITVSVRWRGAGGDEGFDLVTLVTDSEE